MEEEKKYTMAELLAEEDARLAEEAKKREQERIEYQEKLRIEKERKHQEYLEMKEQKRIEWEAEKERRRLEWEAEKEKRANTFEDKTLTCKKCGNEWVWTAGEQKFFKEKGFFRPSMCKECRKSMKVINNFRQS